MATRRVDDSDEGEATALDLRPSSRSAARPPSPPPSPRTPSPLPAPIKRAGLADQSSEDDGEATEFLSVRPPSRGPQAARSSSSEAVPRAQGRAVPIEGASGPPSMPSSPPTAPLPPGPAAAGLPTTAPDSIRPLPHRTIGTDLSTTGTSSVPRVTRIHVVARGGSTTNGEEELVDNTASEVDVDATIPPGLVVKAPAPPSAATNLPRTSPRGKSPTRVDARDDETQAGDDPDDTQAPSAQEAAQVPAPVVDPPPRGLPTSAEGEPVPARSRPLPRQNTPQAATDGVLVVDAPPDATVFVNGVERGRGTVKIADLDREARHAVRIHCQGFSPWSGSVSLQGKPAAKIRPALKPRAR